MNDLPPRPGVLVAAEMLEALARQLEADYEVYRLWNITDQDAFLREAGPTVRAVVTIGNEAPPASFLAALPSLELIGFTGTGYESLDVAWARQSGVKLCYGQGANAADVAEHAVAMALAAWRGVVRGNEIVKSGEWLPQTRPRSHNLNGRRVGIVGMGRIGEETARRFAGFGVQIRWWGPRPKPAAAYERADSLIDLALWSDILILCSRADAANAGMIDTSILDALGAEGLLVNVARGSLVDEAALIERLASGALGGAALDVFAVEPTHAGLWATLPNAIVTPHIAGGTFEAAGAMWALLRRNLGLHFAGEPLETPLILED